MAASTPKNHLPLTILAAACAITTLIAGLSINDRNLMQLFNPLQVLLLLVFVIWHGSQVYGAKGIAIFFVVSQVVSNAMENLSISTGFPFGNYHYSQGGMPFLFQVPIVIGLAYFAYGYLAWTLAKILLGSSLGSRVRSTAQTIILPLTAAFLMVMWDVIMDPINSTIRHYWIWENGGGFNGVPLTNYLGWFLTVYLFFQIFALLVRAPLKQQVSKVFWATPIKVYVATGLSFILMYLVAIPSVITDATGHSWDQRSIYETAAIVSLFTMIFAGFLATIKLLRSEETPHH